MAPSVGGMISSPLIKRLEEEIGGGSGRKEGMGAIGVDRYQPGGRFGDLGRDERT